MSNEATSILLTIVSAALLLDSITLTMVVPIVPNFILEEDEEYIRKNSSRGVSSGLIQLVDAERENSRVGLLLSSKAVVQLILNPLVGQWTKVAGYSIPLFTGTCLLLLSTSLFAMGDSYVTLFVARTFHGISSACLGVTGMCVIADTFTSEPARSRAMGFALGSAASGVLIGYPFGGLFYDLFGKTTPFIIVALLVFALALIEFRHLPVECDGKKEDSAHWRELLSDRRILICGGTIGISTSAMAVLEPCLPIWLLGHIKPRKWQLGTVFIPDSIGYVIGTNSFSLIAYKAGRLRVATAAMSLVAFSCLMIPLASSMIELVIPHFLLGFGIGAVDSALVPLLASLADVKTAGGYGTVYTVQQMAVCLAYFLGPMVGGSLVKAIGFPWLMTTVGLLNFFYSLFLVYLELNNTGNTLLGMEKNPINSRLQGYQNLEEENISDP